MLSQLQKLYAYLKAVLNKSKKEWTGLPNIDSRKRGVYRQDPKTGNLTWVGEVKEPGRIPMPLEEYQARKHHHKGKGSWKRPTDDRYALSFLKRNADYGSIGCMRGFHFFSKKLCVYCGHTKKQIKQAEKRMGTNPVGLRSVRRRLGKLVENEQVDQEI